MTTTSSQAPNSTTCLSGAAKLKSVTELLLILKDNQFANNLPSHDLEAHLETLKVHGRDPNNSDLLFTEEGIRVLAHYAFGNYSTTTSQEALRSLANAMLLRANTRQIFVDLGLEEKACQRLEKDNQDDEFLISRILFLTTYDTLVDLEKLISEFHLAESICINISRHRQKSKERQGSISSNPIDKMALVETMKLMFNVTQFCPHRIATFSTALPDLLPLLADQPLIESRPLDPLIWSIVNVIMNLELDTNVEVLFPESTPNIYVDYCVKILDLSTRACDNQELGQEHNISSLIILLQNIYKSAPQSVKDHMCQLLLPSEEDRDKVLGRSESLPSRILRLSSSSLTPQLRDSISVFLFELSGRDAQAFIQNIGYGYASGFLMKNNLQIPETTLESWSTKDKGGKETNSSEINPITGQFIEKEAKIELAEMTIEEKEREAEKLFVLFERLNKTGVITVPNYLEAAVNSGKFENLDEDANSD
ncbi:hypothetical protein K3495_g11249 [Podosphaera aphanis]|nr:hypothetical protein K3495_g11249 [Podosphaera aphanis]